MNVHEAIRPRQTPHNGPDHAGQWCRPSLAIQGLLGVFRSVYGAIMTRHPTPTSAADRVGSPRAVHARYRVHPTPVHPPLSGVHGVHLTLRVRWVQRVHPASTVHDRCTPVHDSIVDTCKRSKHLLRRGDVNED
jgi:hypothetical protein